MGLIRGFFELWLDADRAIIHLRVLGTLWLVGRIW
jgi:hypothetical protein